jgi:catechol 2,3-dioxygenase
MAETVQARAVEEVNPIAVLRVGHVVFRVRDIQRSIKFYTEVLNFRLTEEMDGRLVFLNVGGDHHTIALCKAGHGAEAQQPSEDDLGLDHFAMQVPGLDDLFRIREYLRRKNVPIFFEGRRMHGGQASVEFLDPDGYRLEFFCEMSQVTPDGRVPPHLPRHAVTLEEARDLLPQPTL